MASPRTGPASSLLLVLAAGLAVGCYQGLEPQAGPAADGGSTSSGSDGGVGEASSGSGTQPDPDEAASLGPVGIRRLSRHEYAATVELITGVKLSEADLVVFPQDSLRPFDNDYEEQTASEVLIDGLQELAALVAGRVMEDVDLRGAMMPCTPTDAMDAGCMRALVERFGRLALRRPVPDEQIDTLVMAGIAAATEDDDFFAGADLIVQVLLQDMEFLYRVELGPPHPDDSDLLRLDDHAVASRLSFLLWGTGPDGALLDRAEGGELASDEGVRLVAADMLEDPRARDRVARFVSMWLGYALPLPDEDLGPAMRTESAALVERVIFDERASMHELFTSEVTFLSEELAEHYGLPAPADPAGSWVEYGSSPRRGVLSHATFLSNGVKGNETSPTVRGLNIRKRLTCEVIPPPPPDANADEPPQAEDPDACKAERYAAHSTNAGCAGCHVHMDPIGFGLENYDALGRYRETEPDRPQCRIEGRGELSGVGSFKGPAELGDALVESKKLDRCAVLQMFRFAMGRPERPVDSDYIDELADAFSRGDYRFDELLLAFVGDPGFRYRLIDNAGA